MSWLKTVLGAANLVADVAQISMLEQLRSQGAKAGAIQAVLQELRNRIFNYKQAAEEILATENKDPKRAAAALKLLESHLKDLGIAPELFPDIGDKEYVAATIRFMHDNSSRLIGQLPSEEQAEVNEMASTAVRLTDYTYYTATYADAQRYKQSESVVKRLKRWNVGTAGYLYLGLIPLVLYIGLFSAIFRSASPRGGVSDIAIVLGIAAFVATARWFYIKVMRRSEYKAAKRVVDELKNKLDMKRFDELDGEFRGNLEGITALQQRAQALLNKYLGEGYVALK